MTPVNWKRKVRELARLKLDQDLVDTARTAAAKIVSDLKQHIDAHTTVSVERSALRLLGVDGVNRDGIPLPNVLVEQIQRRGKLGLGAAYWLGNAILASNLPVQPLAEAAGQGRLDITGLADQGEARVQKLVEELAVKALGEIASRRQERELLLRQLGEGPQPYLYVIVATGNIYEDVIQARAAVTQGADIIAVIRSTGQSLLDYVPYGPTTEGFGGTFATQENFRIMRQALDEAGSNAGRYIRLTNYCSGLCMPEIAVMGALERLDMMLNDSMYGIIFRDINMQRTFVDQYFSRLINAYAGIIINTGEDNYLTTADAVEEAHAVLASQFINEQFAFLSGMQPDQVGLGHAFEINPELEDGFLLELAQAQLVRQIFPGSPVKYMPPTKFMTGNIFRGQVQDALFNAASILTGQSIHLLGMLTEGIHTPLVMDRALSIENARYVFRTMRHLGEEISFRPGGRIETRAGQVLARAVTLLEEIAAAGLMQAIGRGVFAGIARTPSGGKGLDGVIAKEPGYYNPFPARMLAGRGSYGRG